MVKIRIPREHWGRVWRVLLAAGPVSRIDQDTHYLVSEEQVRILKRNRLPFEVLTAPNGQATNRQHG
jgi:hypothetical protein